MTLIALLHIRQGGYRLKRKTDSNAARLGVPAANATFSTDGASGRGILSTSARFTAGSSEGRYDLGEDERDTIDRSPARGRGLVYASPENAAAAFGESAPGLREHRLGPAARRTAMLYTIAVVLLILWLLGLLSGYTIGAFIHVLLVIALVLLLVQLVSGRRVI
jgi:hypothetical protein